MPSVPFFIPRLFAGFGQCHGVLHDEGDMLRFEFQIRDKFGGFLKSRVRQVRVPVQEIAAVQLVRGWRKAKILIQSSNLATLKEIPGMQQSIVKLCIARKDVGLAEAFVDGLYTEDDMPGS